MVCKCAVRDKIAWQAPEDVFTSFKGKNFECDYRLRKAERAGGMLPGLDQQQQRIRKFVRRNWSLLNFR